MKSLFVPASSFASSPSNKNGNGVGFVPATPAVSTHGAFTSSYTFSALHSAHSVCPVCPFLSLPRNRVGRVAYVVTAVLLVLVCVRFVGLAAQRHRLRLTVERASQVLNQCKLLYWWDFGTLLGLVREGDIIWTEVDADLSVSKDSRDRLWGDEQVRKALEDAGFPVVEQRDEMKLRIYESWGWYLDTDVWSFEDAKMAAARRRRHRHSDRAPGDDEDDGDEEEDSADLETAYDDQYGVKNPLQRAVMATGRLDLSVYDLPAEWILPISTITAASVGQGAVSMSVPARPEKVLAWWYGDTWRVPRKFDKGKDASQDGLEVFLWTYLLFLYEVFLAVKVLARLLYYGLLFHKLFLLFHALVVAGVVGTACALRSGAVKDRTGYLTLGVLVCGIIYLLWWSPVVIATLL